MKRLICRLLGHRWEISVFVFGSWADCSRCGKQTTP